MFKMPLLDFSANSLAQSLPFVRKLALLLVVGAVLADSVVDAQNWSNWRGPEQNGISRDTNLADDWSFEPRKNVAWVAETGGRATPIIQNGRVFLNCRTEDDVVDPDTKVNALSLIHI